MTPRIVVLSPTKFRLPHHSRLLRNPAAPQALVPRQPAQIAAGVLSARCTTLNCEYRAADLNSVAIRQSGRMTAPKLDRGLVRPVYEFVSQIKIYCQWSN